MVGRIPSLDGIRAVSILFVIICHLGNDLGWGDPFVLGELGVRIFFVISGFLITNILLGELERDGTINLPRFYFRRTLRIMPAYYAYIGAILIISALGFSSLTFKGAVPALTYTSNYWRLPGSAWYHTIAHTWSLSTEEQFYLVWPAILMLLGRGGARIVLLVVLAGAPVARSIVYMQGHWQATQWFQFNFDHIGMGCLLAFLRKPLHESAIYKRLLSFPLTPLLLVLPIEWIDTAWKHPGIRDTIGGTVVDACIALGIDWAVTNSENSVLGRVLNFRWLTAIGVLSYSLYLWQQPFLYLHLDGPTLFLRGPGTILRNPAVAVPAIFACATMSYFWVERPWLRLRERWEPFIFPKPVRVQTAIHPLRERTIEGTVAQDATIAPPNESESLA